MIASRRAPSVRASLVSTVVLAAFAASSAASALQASDTMAAWQGATANEKTELVGELLRQDSYGGSATSVISCLDGASGVAGHADLRIAEVAKACRANSGDPV